MDTIYKILENVEVKKVGERQYEFTASTADMDRDGEVIDVEGWDLKNFKKNPVIMYAHAYNTLPIGKATHIGVKDGKLKNTIEFPPEGTYEFADIVERLVNTGYLKTESVGFIPRKWEDGDGGEKTPRRTYTKQELLEISIVPIPSNPHALRDAVEAGVITIKQFESIAIPENESLENLKPYPNEHACRLQDPDKFSEFRRGTHSHEGKKYSVIFGKPKEGEGWEEQAYRYDKDIWEATEARSHCKSHDGKFEAAKPEKISQEQIIDEIDYLITLLDKDGISDEVKDSLQGLAKYIERLPVNDITVNIEPEEEIITYQEIREAIKRLSKMEE